MIVARWIFDFIMIRCISVSCVPSGAGEHAEVGGEAVSPSNDNRDVVDQSSRADERGDRDQRVRRRCRVDRLERRGVDDLGVVERGPPARCERRVATTTRGRRPRRARRGPTASDAMHSAPRRARCAAAVVGGEVRVAARHREAVGLADERAADHLDRQVEVGGHAPDDRELLGVLAPEVGAARPDDREQLGDDRGHAVEVSRAGSRRTDPSVSPSTCTVVRAARRVHLVDRRARTARRRPRRSRPRRRPRGRAGSASRSSVGPNCVGFTNRLTTTKSCRRARRAHQRTVAFVEVAHRGDEADVPHARARRRTRRGRRRWSSTDDHALTVRARGRSVGHRRDR